MKLLKDSFRVKKKLFFGGRLFYVRCCAHILNLMVKDGIKSVEYIIDKIRDTVNFVNASEARLVRFSEVVQQLQLHTRKLVMDCPTRWNSTYSMLTVALRLREAFFSYNEREVAYVACPTEEEWDKIEKVCDILGFFNEATDIISGTDYPTANLFLSQICTIKKVLDDGAISTDNFIVEMTKKMKAKFDKYWGECNLLMAFGAVMDPRMKFVVIEFAYPKIYHGDESMRNVQHVRCLLYEMYEEYVRSSEAELDGDGGIAGGSSRSTTNSLQSVDHQSNSK
ncbi:Putative AC transposase [Dendrobium catenatum]|uniref:AC transposase n=1 Tax=Dendrobium catenatum TaxID=906689 RepID=A0A2I0WI83_9ASPA|nr:Putative AC transposase [Dendrobium catenatum]